MQLVKIRVMLNIYFKDLTDNDVREAVQVNFIDTENDPVLFDSVNIISSQPFLGGELTDECLNALNNVVRNYSQSRGVQYSVTTSSENGAENTQTADKIYLIDLKEGGTDNFASKDHFKYIHPKEKTGNFAPLLIEDAPIESEKKYEIDIDGKMIFSDGFGVSYKDIPGHVINNGYPGNDGAVYSIDSSSLLKKYDLYRCRKIIDLGRTLIEIGKVVPSLTFEQLQEDYRSISLFYNVLDRVGIGLEGHEVVGLGLPIHNGKF